MEEYKKYWVNFTNFTGRTTRKEFWIPVLFNIVISSILSSINTTLGSIFALIIFIPSLAIGIRRLHDINKSGWNLLWAFLPFIGWIVLIVFYCTATVNEGNNYPAE